MPGLVNVDPHFTTLVDEDLEALDGIAVIKPSKLALRQFDLASRFASRDPLYDGIDLIQSYSTSGSTDRVNLAPDTPESLAPITPQSSLGSSALSKLVSQSLMLTSSSSTSSVFKEAQLQSRRSSILSRFPTVVPIQPTSASTTSHENNSRVSRLEHVVQTAASVRKTAEEDTIRLEGLADKALVDAQTEVDVLTESAQKLATEKRQHAERIRAKYDIVRQRSKLELDQRTRLVDEGLRRTKIATIERAAAIRTQALKTGGSASSENSAEREAKEVEDRWRHEYHQAELDYEQETRTIYRTFEQGMKEAADIEAEARLIQKTTDRQVRDLLEDAKRRADEFRKEARKRRARITKEVDRLYRELEAVQLNSTQEMPGTRPPTSRLKRIVGGLRSGMKNGR